MFTEIDDPVLLGRSNKKYERSTKELAVALIGIAVIIMLTLVGV